MTNRFFSPSEDHDADRILTNGHPTTKDLGTIIPYASFPLQELFISLLFGIIWVEMDYDDCQWSRTRVPSFQSSTFPYLRVNVASQFSGEKEATFNGAHILR